jgi:hypothetical protein
MAKTRINREELIESVLKLSQAFFAVEAASCRPLAA